jgi:flagellar biosynthesis/type III secretory pathway ATPase
MPALIDDKHQSAARIVRGWLAAHREGRDLIEIGAYKPGTNPRLDQAVARMPAIDALLRQGTREISSTQETKELLALVVKGMEGGR